MTRRVFVAVSVRALALWALTAGLAHAEKVDVTVLHTTDLHGHILPTEDYSDDPAPRGLARLATLVRRERAADPKALLVDAGDCIQGAPLELVAHTRLQNRPEPMMLVMNEIGYDAMAVGNHDYEWGVPALRKAQKEARFVFLSANTQNDRGRAFDPYKVFTVQGVKIGVLGLTTPAIPNWLDRDKYAPLEFVSSVEAARRWVPVLRNKEKVDAVVVVTHQGLERDAKSGEAHPGMIPGENAAYALASEVPGIDLIVMGHTHQPIAFERVNGVLLTQAGKWAENLGKAVLTFERDHPREAWKLTGKRADLIPVTLETPVDEKVMALAEPYARATAEYLNEEVATADGRFDGARGRLEDNAVVDLVHAAQLAYGEADVSLAALFNPAARFGPGPVRVRDLASVYIYENTLYTIEITGAILRQALEHSANYFHTYDFGRDDQPLVNPGVRGYNYDTAAGVDYEIDLTRPPGQRIRNLRYLGRPLEDDRKLKLAVNSYRVNGGGGYDMLKGARVVRQGHEPVRDLLIAHARQTGTLSARADDNWRLSPHFAADPAREVFERLLARGVWSAEEAAALNPDAPLTRGQFATWLGAAYGPPAERVARARLPYPDVPRDLEVGVKRAAAAGAFTGAKDLTLRPLDPIDLATAVEWTALAANGGRLAPARAGAADRRGRPQANRPAPVEIPELLQRVRVAEPLARYAAEHGFVDEWRGGADPARLTVADGARLLAAARYPVITVLYTNDFHGAIESPGNEWGGDRPVGSSPVLAGWVARERAKNPRGTLLLDGGDLMQGTLISNIDFGRPTIAHMNLLGYDAFAVGNHEFDWSADTLAARVAEARFATLSANLFRKSDGKQPTWVKPYEIFRRRGLDVAVIGFSTVETPQVTLPSHVAHLEFRDGVPIGRRLVPEVRRQGAEVVVLIGHVPSRQDSAGAPIRGELADLAAGVEGEDAVLGGHSHVRVVGRVGDTPVLIAGANGRYLGRVDLVYDRVAGKVVDSRAKLLPTYMDEVEPEPRAAAFADSLRRAIAPLAERVLCQAPAPMGRDRRGESKLGNWVSDVIRAAAGADVALQNPGGLRADVDAGPVTYREVFEVMPFDNRIATVRLTGAQLLEVLEHGSEERGNVQVSGVRFSYDPERPAGERVLEVTLADGSRLDPAREYLVAVNDFMADGGDGYAMLKDGRDLTITEIAIRDALVADCEARGRAGRPLDPPLDGRVQRVEKSSTAGSSNREGAPAGR